MWSDYAFRRFIHNLNAAQQSAISSVMLAQQVNGCMAPRPSPDQMVFSLREQDICGLTGLDELTVVIEGKDFPIIMNHIKSVQPNMLLANVEKIGDVAPLTRLNYCMYDTDKPILKTEEEWCSDFEHSMIHRVHERKQVVTKHVGSQRERCSFRTSSMDDMP